MAVIAYLTCGLFAGFACWIALGGSLGGKALAARSSMIAHVGRGLLARAGGSRAAKALLGWNSVAACARELATRARGAGLSLSLAEAAVVLLLATMAISLACGLSARSAGIALTVFGALALAMHLRAMSQERRRREALAQEMPAVFRTLANSLSAGHTLVQSLDYVGVHERGEAGEAFARASLRLRCGMSAEDALHELGVELDAPGVGLMVTALAISQRTGSPLRELFQRSAQLVEQQGELSRTLSVKTAQVRLSVRIVCGLPPIMVLFLALVSPDYQSGLTSTSGIACLVVAALMDGIALLAIRRIMGGAIE